MEYTTQPLTTDMVHHAVYTTELPTVDVEHHAMHTTQASTTAADCHPLLWSDMLCMQMATCFLLCR
jgi:hypothetical protein